MNIRNLAAQLTQPAGTTAGMAKNNAANRTSSTQSPTAQTTQSRQPKSAPVKLTNCLWGGFWGWLGYIAVSDFKNDINDFVKRGQKNINAWVHDPKANDGQALVKAADKFAELKKAKLDKNGIQIKKFTGEVKELLFDYGFGYDKKAKTLVVHAEKPGLGIFKAITKLAQNQAAGNAALWGARAFSVLTLPLVLTAVCSRKKIAPEGQELSKKDKFTNYVRNNAGKLAMLLCVPSILYQGVSAVQAIRGGAKVLPSRLVKELAAYEGVGFAKTLVLTAITGAAAFCGVETKDYFQKLKDKRTIKAAQQAK